MTPRDIVSLVQSIVLTLLALGGVVWGAARLCVGKSTSEAREGGALEATVEHLRDAITEVLAEVKAVRAEMRDVPLHAARIDALETDLRGLRVHCVECRRETIALLVRKEG